MDERIEEAKDLLRRAYALLSQLDPPNVRDEVRHHENLALLAEHPKPTPLPPIGPPLITPLGEPQEVE